MRTNLFDFALAAERIAQAPMVPRERAKLLHVADQLTDKTIADLPSLFDERDLLILNNTRVLPTRFQAMRGDAAVEVTLVQALKDNSWWAFAKPGRKAKIGDVLELATGLQAEVEAKHEDGRILLRFELAGEALIERIKAQGSMPLPPYIKRPKGGDEQDQQDYQAIFASRDGSVAAPTASLHLTEALLEAIRNQGTSIDFVTLHVGMGTFLPVKTDDTADHVMHKEWYEVPADTAAQINDAKAKGMRITAVGTTVMRTLESAAKEGVIQPGSSDTALFIKPGFRFQIVDRLLTNFHLPRSTLMMLVAAFSGLDKIQAAYAHAIAHDYRFFSYGDACFLERP